MHKKDLKKLCSGISSCMLRNSPGISWHWQISPRKTHLISLVLLKPSLHTENVPSLHCNHKPCRKPQGLGTENAHLQNLLKYICLQALLLHSRVRGLNWAVSRLKAHIQVQIDDGFRRHVWWCSKGMRLSETSLWDRAPGIAATFRSVDWRLAGYCRALQAPWGACGWLSASGPKGREAGPAHSTLKPIWRKKSVTF